MGLLQHFRNDERHLDLSQSKEQVFNRKNNDTVIETHLICLVGRLLDIGIYPERFNNLTKGENNVLNRLIDEKYLVTFRQSFTTYISQRD